MVSPVSGSVMSQSPASGRTSCPARASRSTTAVPVAVLPGVRSTVMSLPPGKTRSTASLVEDVELSTVSNSPVVPEVTVSPVSVSVTASFSSTTGAAVCVSVVTVVSVPVSLPLSWTTRPSSSTTVVSVVTTAPSTTGSSPSGLVQVISVVMVVILPSSLTAASAVPAASAGALSWPRVSAVTSSRDSFFLS